MKRSTRWMVFMVYYLSQLLGLLGFSYNSKSVKVETSPFVTIYSGIISALMLFAVPVLFHLKLQAQITNGHDLAAKISAVMYLIQVIVVLITTVLNWTKRRQFIATITDLIHLRENFIKKFKMSVKVERFYENAIRKKFFWGLISNITRFFLSPDLLNGIFSYNFPPVNVILVVMIIVLNLIMSHHFFALLNINALLAVVNEEIKRILNSSSILAKLQSLKKIKAGALVNTCCRLADELDELAIQHYNLQNMGERINSLYDFHGVCFLLTLYLNNIAIIYSIYVVSQRYKVDVVVGMGVLIILSLLFCMDLSTYLTNMLKCGKFVRKTAILLKNLQHLMPSLDERFEKSLKNFSIQLAAFPFEMKLLGLFQFNQRMAFATFASATSSAILLVQYDYKYAEN